MTLIERSAEVFANIGGNFVHTVTHGSGDEVIVALPGLFSTVEVWEQPFELLHQRFTTVAFDHYGTGDTYVSDETVTFENQVTLIGALLDHLDIDRCLLASDSKNNAVVMSAADRWPHRVRGLIMVGSATDFSATETLIRFVKGLRQVYEPTLRAFVDYCVPEDTDGHLRRWVYDIIDRTGGQRAATLVESMYDIDIEPLMAGITAPALIVHGSRDPVHPPEDARELAAALADGQYAQIQGAGHVPTVTRPTEVASAIERFVRQLP